MIFQPPKYLPPAVIYLSLFAEAEDLHRELCTPGPRDFRGGLSYHVGISPLGVALWLLRAPHGPTPDTLASDDLYLSAKDSICCSL